MSTLAESDLLRPFLERPAGCAVLMDVDGTLAPIVARPEDAAVPPATSALLRELGARFGLVACITGRPARVARSMVGVRELVYVGNQGFEVLDPRSDTVRAHPAAQGRDRLASGFVAQLDWDELEALGIRNEDKGAVQVLHWRGAAEPTRAQERTDAIARHAVEQGLVPLVGRRILELRPAVPIDKGTAARELIAERGPFEAAVFAGDDVTDLDVFRALGELTDEGLLESAVRVGVRSPEAPAEVLARADLIVDDTEGVAGLLRALAG